ncbi:MAG: UDP-N-acetylmuramoyl-L-alanine--D-glutamate ligase [Candidatus Wolfebacteria bacterium]|nr:UDP-N-acetylmuramoyl-L-alanine--D-glutamate ligase [Candidatus Wolfebacteria bacterium]
MVPYKNYFRNKKITVMGLGLLGRGLHDIKFLAECGAKLIVTDLKTKEQLKSSLLKLKKFKNVAYRLGGHKLEDFRNRDMIIKAAGVPLKSPFITEARKNNIPVEMSSALFARLSGIPIIGVTGTRGKSTVTHLIYHLLKTAKLKVLLGGNIKGISTLALLNKVKSGDIAVLELDSWQLQGFGGMKMSPHIAVFTNLLPDHQNYYENDMDRYFTDKANIFKFQTKKDFTIAGASIAGRIKTKGKKIIPKFLPSSWLIKLPGKHNRNNAALAIAAVKIFGLNDEIIKKGLRTFNGVPGRLELIREVRGIKFYNDTTATTPDATRIGLMALGKNNKLILIMGGSDKKLNMDSLLKIIPKYCKKIILLPGTGTDNLPAKFKNNCVSASTMKEAVREAVKISKQGDIVLLSPAFASFGLFKNEFDRGEKFNQLVRKLK